jgi:hypothetical protein
MKRLPTRRRGRRGLAGAERAQWAASIQSKAQERSMYSVSVRCDAHDGIGELKGVLRFDGRQLCLQYQTADPIMHEFRMHPVTLELPPDMLVSARVRPGFLWLMPWLDLQVSDIAALAPLPTPEAGRLKLRLRFAERADARRIVDEIGALRTEVRLAELDRSLERMTSTLPGRARQAPPQAPAREE